MCSHAGRKDIQLVSVSVGGKQVGKDQYERTDKKLILKGLPSSDFTVDIEVQIKPQVRHSAMAAWVWHPQRLSGRSDGVIDLAQAVLGSGCMDAWGQGICGSWGP